MLRSLLDEQGEKIRPPPSGKYSIALYPPPSLLLVVSLLRSTSRWRAREETVGEERKT